MLLLLALVLGCHSVLSAPFVQQPDFALAIESLPASDPDPSSRDAAYWNRRREEETLLAGIQDRIWSMLKLPCMPRPPAPGSISLDRRRLLDQLVRRMQDQSSRGQSDLVKRAQSFYPSCDHPAELDPSEWQLTPSLNVYFNLTQFFPSVPENVTIDDATLRVYKVAEENTLPVSYSELPQHGATIHVSLYAYAAPSNGSADGGWPQPAAADAWQPAGPSDGWGPPPPAGWPGAAPAAAAAGRARLVDSATVPLALQDWLQFDVRAAVQAWQVGAANWGFLLVVENEKGRRLQPEVFFKDMDCDIAMPSSPMPGFLLRAAQEEDVPVSLERRFPVLDLQTSEPADLEGGSTVASEEPCPYPEGGAAPTHLPAFSDSAPPRRAGRPNRRRHRYGQRRTGRRPHQIRR